MPTKENEVRELFGTILRVRADQIDDATGPADIERWDSMQHMILVSAFEEEFGLDVDPDEAVEMYKDFGTFKRIVLQKMGV
jgi:acyl carrier protein